MNERENGQGAKSQNRNQDIEILLTLKPMLCEIKELRNTDMEEQKAILGAPRMDGMPRGNGYNGDLSDVVSRAESIHKRRLQLIDAYESKVTLCEVILRKIPFEQRLVARLLYVSRLPIWRVAALANMSESTVKRMKADMERKERF